jgi:hypothetical protein
MAKYLTLFEKEQQIQTLSAIIWIVLRSSVIPGFLNIQYRTWGSASGLFGLAFVCLFLLQSSTRGQFNLSALLSSIVVLLFINLNLLRWGWNP